MNGREWLARQMGRAGMKYVRQDNCFQWVEDWGRAQRLLDRQLRTNWPKWLGRIARELNPVHAQIFGDFPMNYYWTTYQSEWAIHVVFGQAQVLRRLYPRVERFSQSGFAEILLC
jgi:hypothetical protein